MSISEELKGQFLRLYQLAICDDEFSPSELKMLYRFAEERGVSNSDLDKLLKLEPTEIIAPKTVSKKIEYLYDMCRMIWADGRLDENEKATLEKYARKFEFEEENINELCSYLLDAAYKDTPKSKILSELN